MKTAIAAAVLVLALSGCATPKMQGANEAGGMIRYGNRYSGDAAFAEAEAHCARYGRIARPTRQNESFVWTLFFDCVDRPAPVAPTTP